MIHCYLSAIRFEIITLNLTDLRKKFREGKFKLIPLSKNQGRMSLASILTSFLVVFLFFFSPALNIGTSIQLAVCNTGPQSFGENLDEFASSYLHEDNDDVGMLCIPSFLWP